MIGETISHYKIKDKMGEGGMGVVYRAHDTKLQRDVALKVLPASLAGTAGRRARFEREATAIAALKHPNIVTIHSIEEFEGTPFITMELVEGGTLGDAIAAGGMAPDRFVAIAETLADALAAAHQHGVIHRDLKPANIMFDADGRLKVLDFGLAKLFDSQSDSASDPNSDETINREDSAHRTREGQILGTLAYMSPEQADGRVVDQRSDIFSFGIILYQLATGELPFKGATNLSTISSVLKDNPQTVTSIRKAFPRPLSAIIHRCLEKRPDDRYASADVIAADLRRYREAMLATRTGGSALLRQPRVAIPIVVGVLALVAVAMWWSKQRSREGWAREVALPEIERLANEATADEGLGRWEAFQLAREAQRIIPEDPMLLRLLKGLTTSTSIPSTPPGARVYARPYAGPDLEWEYIGSTPIDTLRYLNAALRIKLEKDGYETVHDVLWAPAFVFGRNGYELPRPGEVPEGMVLLPDSAGIVQHPAAPAGLHLPGIEHLPPQRTGDFYLDRTEVTNADYKRFVDSGGYTNRDFWKFPFSKEDGRTMTWEEAMALFVDRTGRAGPSTWEVGDYPDGQGDYPVSGVSWFEAAAYAEWAGKSLPTIYHWDHGAFTWASGYIVPPSNFSGEGPVPVGSRNAENRFGTQDLAGNVREWCFNRSTRLGRFILGGGWNDPVYAFNDAYAQSPFDRSPTNGFRCMKYADETVDRAALEQTIEMPYRDFMKETPVSDETYRLFLKQFDYDRTPLNASIEETREEGDWIRQKVSFDAAYGGERMMAYLFLPRDTQPPYQAVLYFPGSGAIHTPSSDQINLSRSDFIPKSGRALVFPIYKSTYERGDDLKSDYPAETNFWKDHVVMWQKDLSRTIDYLETREDIDSGKLAYFGSSWGSAMSPMMIAPEPRIQVGIVIVAGVLFHRSFPEVDAVHYLPRVKVPMLILNGKYDFFFPYETAQVPYFKLLGTPEADKRMVVNESGHSFPRTDLARETLQWLDHYLGPVE